MLSKFRPAIRKMSAKRVTVDPREMKHFDQMAKDWWDEKGDLEPLHALNKCRIPWILDRLKAVGVIGAQADSHTLLKGLTILDVGCGGGILTESLSRLGCTITGLDANEELISVAKYHANKQNLPNLNYECALIQDHAVPCKEKYDVVVASEVIEHVTEKEEFVKYSVQCLKPGGSIFFTTPNRTWLSWFCAIIIIEDILKVLPKGTHEYDKFIAMTDLLEMLKKENCRTVFTSGLIYQPFKPEWKLIKSQKVSYVIHAIKNS